MKSSVLAILLGITLSAQTPDTAESHVAAAKALAANDQTALLQLCTPATMPAAPAGTGRAAAAPQSQGPPARATWARKPIKVFDNLYDVGEQNYSAWAVTTSAGIVIIDAIFDYSVEEQVVGGLKTLGLDPSQIKYVVISHAHRDHVGGARYLQERFGAHVMMTAADWQLPFARCVGMLMVGQRLAERDAHGNAMVDDDLLLLLNAHHEAIEFALPGEGWAAVLDTSNDQAAPARPYSLQPRSLALLVRSGSR